MRFAWHLLLLSYLKLIALWNSVEAKSLIAMDLILNANINKTSKLAPSTFFYSRSMLANSCIINSEFQGFVLTRKAVICFLNKRCSFEFKMLITWVICRMGKVRFAVGKRHRQQLSPAIVGSRFQTVWKFLSIGSFANQLGNSVSRCLGEVDTVCAARPPELAHQNSPVSGDHCCIHSFYRSFVCT